MSTPVARMQQPMPNEQMYFARTTTLQCQIIFSNATINRVITANLFLLEGEFLTDAYTCWSLQMCTHGWSLQMCTHGWSLQMRTHAGPYRCVHMLVLTDAYTCWSLQMRTHAGPYRCVHMLVLTDAYTWLVLTDA